MATLEDVSALARRLPEATEEVSARGRLVWSVGGKAFAWERPFTKADLRRFGDATPPDAPIVAVRVEDLGEKEVVLAADHAGFFTTPHFEGYPAVLIALPVVAAPALEEAITDGWLACAPPSLTEQYEQGGGAPARPPTPP